ncbi:MAG: XrtA-associated ATPase [Gammaproteobacteria bacterium]
MYETFYKLRDKPFQLGPDPRFFFGSRSHKRAMAYLRYGLNQGEGFIVITGDIGTGKTTLMRTLFADLVRENVVAAQLVTTQLEADDMLRMVSASFGLAHEGISKAALLKNLETFLAARAREGKRVLLVVDEAQNIPVRSLEELRMLSNFQTGDKALLQSFLLGQAEFRHTLQSDGMEQLRQRVIAAYHLAPLDADETKSYIEHRLRRAGWSGDPTFTDAAYAAIHLATGGIPRRINTFCDRLLLYGFLEEIHEIDGETVALVDEELRQESPRSNRPVEAPGGASSGAAVEQRLAALELSMRTLQESIHRELGLIRRAVSHDNDPVTNA